MWPFSIQNGFQIQQHNFHVSWNGKWFHKCRIHLNKILRPIFKWLDIEFMFSKITLTRLVKVNKVWTIWKWKKAAEGFGHFRGHGRCSSRYPCHKQSLGDVEKVVGISRLDSACSYRYTVGSIAHALWQLVFPSANFAICSCTCQFWLTLPPNSDIGWV